MDEDEYMQALLLAYAAARAIATLPLEQMREAQSRAEAVAPILDPTLYRAKADVFREDCAVTSLLAETKRRLLERVPELGSELSVLLVEKIKRYAAGQKGRP